MEKIKEQGKKFSELEPKKKYAVIGVGVGALVLLIIVIVLLTGKTKPVCLSGEYANQDYKCETCSLGYFCLDSDRKKCPEG